MNGKYFGQSKSKPKSFLVGNTFNPNSTTINTSRPKVKCILSSKKIKNFMSENKLYFETKNWMKKRNLRNSSHQNKCIVNVNEKNYSDEIKRYINYGKQPKLIKCNSRELYSKLSNRDKNKLSLNNLLEKRLFKNMTSGHKSTDLNNAYNNNRNNGSKNKSFTQRKVSKSKSFNKNEIGNGNILPN